MKCMGAHWVDLGLMTKQQNRGKRKEDFTLKIHKPYRATNVRIFKVKRGKTKISFPIPLSSFLLSLFLLANLSFAQDVYDVIVVGSEPEAISAAVAASESGAKTMLVTTDPKLGGLFVMGQMNSLDLRTEPFNYQQGLFLRWWEMVGKGHSFDVEQAEGAFEELLVAAGVEVHLGSNTIIPLMDGNKVIGLQADEAQGHKNFYAKHFIDGTADMNFATIAGASSTFGFSGIGFGARMVDTLVFRIDGVDWPALQAGIRSKGKDYAVVDSHVAWGHFGGYPAKYKAIEEGIRLRGLNLGQQNDGTVLVNALLIYGINPYDPTSIATGFAKAEREAPRIIEYLKLELPGFENASYGGVADKLYIRETRHLDAECTLTTDDVLDNRVTEFAVAAGGYPLDVQTLTPYDNGYVYGTPDIYGVELCVNVPLDIENLWVVGKAAGYDAIAASSARVVPLGMVLGEAVGVAAAYSAAHNEGPRVLVKDTAALYDIRATLQERGAYLPEVKNRNPVGPFNHPYYRDYRLMLGRGLAVGGYNNEPSLDEPMKAISYVYLLSNVAQRFFANEEMGPELVASYSDSTTPLTPELALTITHDLACKAGLCLEQSWGALIEHGLAPATFPPSQPLSRGEMYALAARIAQLSPVLSQR
jgi:FAD dependent oxidoreductase